MDISSISDAELLEILQLCTREFWHIDGYSIDEKFFFTREGKYHHTEYHCSNKSDLWFVDATTFDGKVIHMDEINDVVDSRGIRDEH